MNKPSVINKPSPNYSSRGGTAIDVIVLHHTGSNNGGNDVAWLCNPASQVSAHYVVDRDGRIYQLVSDENRAWHAGECALRGVPTNMNSRSLGIEIVNDGSGNTPYTEAQYRSLEALVPYLAQTYRVPLENLVGHKDVAIPPGRKTDPSPNFDFARIRRAMEQALRKPITVRFLGRTLDCPVRLEDGQSLVPIRQFAEGLGHSVGWDGRVLIDGRPVTFAFRNDNGTTWAWVRDVASFLRLNVAWDEANQVITLSPQPGYGAQPGTHA